MLRSFASPRVSRFRMLLPALAALGLGGTLAGCGALSPPTPAELALACPKVAIVRDLREVTEFRPGGGRDLTDVASRAALVDYKGSCEYDDEGVTVALTLGMLAERGPALRGGQANYRYFVAVARPDEEQPVTKTEFETEAVFPEGQARVIWGEELAPRIPLPPGANPDDWNAKDWRIFVGWQLTPDQLAYNRSTQAK